MKISIVTPSLNQAAYLPQTMDSILNQEGDFELEYIVVDGLSKDGSVDLIRSKAEEIAASPRPGRTMRWVSEPDRNQSDAINKGLRMASGDIVAYLNSDDFYYPGVLQKVCEAFRQNPEAKWVTGYNRIVNERGEVIRTGVTRYKTFLLDRYRFSWLLTDNFICQPSTFWHREVHEEIGYFNEAYHFAMDFDFWCRLGHRYPPVILPEFLSAFRWYNTSKSGDNFGRQNQEQQSIARAYLSPFSLYRAVMVLNGWKLIVGYKVLKWLKK